MIEGYLVQSLGRGKIRGTQRTFKTRDEANNYAQYELGRDRGVAIDALDALGQKTIFQKNLNITGLTTKFPAQRKFNADFGKLRTQRRRSPLDGLLGPKYAWRHPFSR